LVDALLGAMAWGDIGEHFPNDDPKWRGAASRVFVEEVYRKVLAAGWSVQNLDVTILASGRSSKPFKPAMVKSIAQMLDVAKNQVNVKPAPMKAATHRPRRGDRRTCGDPAGVAKCIGCPHA